MGFSQRVKTTAMIKSARRCCVCREYKGVHIEVHHIVPRSDGGEDTLDNAVALCFDCHTSAGHYNPRHPKGTRFSPEELRRHRDKHWRDVEFGRFTQINPEGIAGIHVRHLLCLDYEIADEVLKGKWDNNPFVFRTVMNNKVADFMRRVLKDELPFTYTHNMPGAPFTIYGRVDHDGSWPTRLALVEDYPEFAAADSRPVRMDDFQKGRIKSSLLRKSAECWDPADLGSLVVEQSECGMRGWFLEYRLRRPAFVFTEIWNRSDHDIVLVGAIASLPSADDGFVQPFNFGLADAKSLDYAPLLLCPGDAVAIPQIVFLTGTDDDDYSFTWSDEKEGSRPLIDFWGYRASYERASGSNVILRVGPYEQVECINVMSEGRQYSLAIHPLNLDRLYITERAWMIGSCPHAVVELCDGEMVYLGEILSDAWLVQRTSCLKMPPDAVRLYICEFEPEQTLIRNICINGSPTLHTGVYLGRGDWFCILVSGGDVVEINGTYVSAFQFPISALQRRQKRSFVGAGLRDIKQYVSEQYMCS